MIILGVDPGAKGGLAWVENTKAGYFRIMRSMPMPLIWPKKGKAKPRLDGRALWEHITSITPFASHAILEQVGSMPGQGVASSFQFGRMFGSMESLLHAEFGDDGLSFTRPSEWKQELAVSAEKGSAVLSATAHFGRDAAEKHWPAGPRGGETIFDGIAEAALLAIFKFRQLAKATG